MNKRRCAKLGRDRLRGRGPLGIEIVTHRENLKFISGQQSLDDESSQIEIVLRSFSIGIEAHFMKQWLVKRTTLVTRVVNNFMEDWEAGAIAVMRRVGKFKLQDKYNGIVIHDKEDGDEPYDEVRKICAIVWDRGTRMFKANTELLRSSNPADIMSDVSSNQPYNINSTLHDIIKAAKLVPEGAAQTSIKLVAAPGASVNPPGAVGGR